MIRSGTPGRKRVVAPTSLGQSTAGRLLAERGAAVQARLLPANTPRAS